MAGNVKTKKQDELAANARQEIGTITEQLSALAHMTVAELKTKYQNLFGEASRSFNKDYLRKKIAWRIQEIAEGGLSKRAKQRIEELAIDAPARFHKKATSQDQPKPVHPKDPRLPMPGSIITKKHKGITHEVKVLGNGFEYQDQAYRSLSKIAKVITGTSWNGFLFFNLTQQHRGSDR